LNCMFITSNQVFPSFRRLCCDLLHTPHNSGSQTNFDSSGVHRTGGQDILYKSICKLPTALMRFLNDFYGNAGNNIFPLRMRHDFPLRFL